MTNKQQKKDWADGWQAANAAEKIELVATNYRATLHKAANEGLCSYKDGMFAGQAMNYQWSQDAVQEGLFRAYIFMQKSSKEVKSPRAWTYKIVFREAERIARRFYQTDSIRPNRHSYRSLKRESLEDLEAIINDTIDQGDAKPTTLAAVFLGIRDDVYSEEDLYTIERILAEHERAQELRTVMSIALTEEERELLDLRFVYDFTHQTIAELTNKSVGTIKSKISRSLAKLRKAYHQKWQEELNQERNAS